MRKLFLALALLVLSGCGLIGSKSPCELQWVDGVDGDFRKKVVSDLEAAKSCSKVQILLVSPGGSVIHGLEVVREIQKAKKHQIVEIHGRSLVASAATLIIAAGTKGHRYVHTRSIVLVHGISQGFSGCIQYAPGATDENSLLSNEIIVLLVQEYAELSGHSPEEVVSWLSCAKSQVGRGELLVQLGLADHVES